MHDKEIIRQLRSLSENQRMILVFFDGERSVPEFVEKFWNPKALEKLIEMEIIRWTMKGYELTEDGYRLARLMDERNKKG